MQAERLELLRGNLKPKRTRILMPMLMLKLLLLTDGAMSLTFWPDRNLCCHGIGFSCSGAMHEKRARDSSPSKSPIPSFGKTLRKFFL